MPKNDSRHFLISIVVPSYNEEGNIEVLSKAIAEQLKNYDYEIIFIDDGSQDSTLSNIKQQAKTNKRIHFVSFSRNFGHQAALRAGLEKARGDCAISMDADMQHPPKLLKTLIDHWQAGYPVVYTRRLDTGDIGAFKKLTSHLFYRVLNRLSGLEIEYGAADFRLLDKKIVQVIRDLPEKKLFLRGFIVWSGFESKAIDYVPAKRFAGKSKYTFKKMVTMAIQGITQFSIKPLHFATILGFISALLGLLYGAYAIVGHFAHRPEVSGWTSVIISVLILGGLQLMVLGIVGEYLGQTFMQTKQRPDYLVNESDIDVVVK